MDRLPATVLELIMDRIFDLSMTGDRVSPLEDNATVLRLALVCRSWVEPARRVGMREIEFETGAGGKDEYINSQKLGVILQDRPQLARHIRDWRFEAEDYRGIQADITQNLETAFSYLGTSANGLHTLWLALDGPALALFSTAALQAIAQRRLTELALFITVWPPPAPDAAADAWLGRGQLVDSMLNGPTARTLKTLRLYVPNCDLCSQYEPRTLPALKTLDLHCNNPLPLLTRLALPACTDIEASDWALATLAEAIPSLASQITTLHPTSLTIPPAYANVDTIWCPLYPWETTLADSWPARVRKWNAGEGTDSAGIRLIEWLDRAQPRGQLREIDFDELEWPYGRLPTAWPERLDAACRRRGIELVLPEC